MSMSSGSSNDAGLRPYDAGDLRGQLMSDRAMSEATRKLLGEAPRDNDLRSRVFKNVVSGENDLTGYVAYSLHEQNRRDWLVAFAQEFARQPNEAETASWLMGEVTPRRLSTYRRLAADALAGRAVPVTPGDDGETAGLPPTDLPAAAEQTALLDKSWTPAPKPAPIRTNRWLLVYVALLAALIGASYLYLRYGLFGR